jgi:glycosyltransferase involved in cell wall biosynthesis
VDSIFAQELEKVEIIIIDDGSADNTQEVLRERYGKNPAVRIIRHGTNKGLGIARNTGLEAARGAFVFFLDADDWLEKEALFRLVRIAVAYNVEIVECGIKKAWSNGRSERYHGYAFSCKGGREALEYMSDYYIGSIAWNKLYSRKFLEENKIRFSEKFWHEDVLFTAQAVYLCKKYISIDTIYCNYFQRNDSITRARPSRLHLESYFALYAGVMEFLDRIGLYKDEAGKNLARNFLKAHCSNELFSKLIRYKDTHSKEEWETDCFKFCSAVFGAPVGYAIADFLIAAADNRECFRTQGIFEPIKKIISKLWQR